MSPNDLSHVPSNTLRGEIGWRTTQLLHAKLSEEAQARLKKQIELRQAELHRREQEERP